MLQAAIVTRHLDPDPHIFAHRPRDDGKTHKGMITPVSGNFFLLTSMLANLALFFLVQHTPDDVHQ